MTEREEDTSPSDDETVYRPLPPRTHFLPPNVPNRPAKRGMSKVPIEDLRAYIEDVRKHSQFMMLRTIVLFGSLVSAALLILVVLDNGASFHPVNQIIVLTFGLLGIVGAHQSALILTDIADLLIDQGCRKVRDE